MLSNLMNDYFSFLTELMTQHAGIFQASGEQLFRAFAVILIVWFGVKSALGAASGGQAAGFHFDHFASLLLTISFGYGMLTYYTVPLPGTSTSFYHLFVDQGLSPSNTLNH